MIHKLKSELVKEVKNPEILNRLKDLGLVPIYNTPAEFTQFIKDEYVGLRSFKFPEQVWIDERCWPATMCVVQLQTLTI